MTENIRLAHDNDISRIAEIEIFNYRLNFYPIFRNDEYYFGELQVAALIEKYRNESSLLNRTYVYDDGVVKGFVRVNGTEVEKLFVEPVLQGQGIGKSLLDYVVKSLDVDYLWALERNKRAISFYNKNGFHETTERKLEENTDEYLVKMVNTAVF